MKNLKTLGGVLAMAFLLVLFQSCTKNLEDYNANNQRTISKLDGLDCTPPSCNSGDYISMISHRQGETPFFWRGGKHDKWGSVNLDCKQTFNGTNFSNRHYFEITAEGGTVKHDPGSGRIGVNSGEEINGTFINVSEKLILKLSPCMVGFKMKGFDLTLCGAPGVTGVIELYNGESKVKEVGYVFPARDRAEKNAYNYGVSFLTQSPNEYFDRVVFRPIEGRISWVGYQKNLGLNDPFAPKYPFFEGTRFYLVDEN
jgi:hypothetical protein